MGIIKQSFICVVIGAVVMGCEVSGNETVQRFASKAEAYILKDYSVSEIKETCGNTVKVILELPAKTKEAVEYTEKTMEKYRNNVV